MRVIALLIFLSLNASAVELRELGLTYHHYQDYSVFPELGGAHADQGLELDMSLDLVGPVYWNNAVHYMTQGPTSEYVGWNYRLGLRVTNNLDVGFEHFSQHMIGQPEIAPHFPLYDALYVILTVYRTDRSPAAIFR